MPTKVAKSDREKVLSDFVGLLEGMADHIFHGRILENSMFEQFRLAWFVIELLIVLHLLNRFNSTMHCPQKLASIINAPDPMSGLLKRNFPGRHLTHPQTAIIFNIDADGRLLPNNLELGVGH